MVVTYSLFERYQEEDDFVENNQRNASENEVVDLGAKNQAD